MRGLESCKTKPAAEGAGSRRDLAVKVRNIAARETVQIHAARKNRAYTYSFHRSDHVRRQQIGR